MAQDNPIPFDPTSASPITPRRRIPPETRTVEARFYSMLGERQPLLALLEGMAYRREDDQDTALLFLKSLDIEAELLALVPEENRIAAEQTLFLLLELNTERQNILEEETEERLIGYLPQHEPMIRAAFDPEGEDIPISEAKRHMRCTLAPATPTAEGGTR